MTSKPWRRTSLWAAACCGRASSGRGHGRRSRTWVKGRLSSISQAVNCEPQVPRTVPLPAPRSLLDAPHRRLAGRLHVADSLHHRVQPPRYVPLLPNVSAQPGNERPRGPYLPDGQRRRSPPPLEPEEGLRARPLPPLGPAERRGRRQIDDLEFGDPLAEPGREARAPLERGLVFDA